MKKLMIFLSFMCLSILSLASTVWATNNIYVDVAVCPNQGSGREEDPFCDIQDGIDLAVDGDHVVIAQGVYTRDRSKNLDFHGKKITVRSTVPENPAVVEQTVIDCQKDGRGFYLHGGETLESVIDGLTITNGYGDYGGGIKIAHDDLYGLTSATVRNCVIKGNSSSRDGGGMQISSGETQVINCIITSNSAGDTGGGINVVHRQPDKSISVINSTISYNNSDYWNSAGGIDAGSGVNGFSSSLILRDSLIEHNNPVGIVSLFENISIDNCIIRSHEGGLGVDIYGGVPNVKAEIFNSTIAHNGEEGMSIVYIKAEIKNCIIRNNKDGGVYLEEGEENNTSIVDSIIVDNEGPWASGIHVSAVASSMHEIKRTIIANNMGNGVMIGMFNSGRPLNVSFDISNSFIGNNQGSGLGSFDQLGDGHLSLRNSTIANNMDAGIEFSQNSVPFQATLRNNIFWGNGSAQGYQISSRSDMELLIEYCDVQNGEEGVFELPVGSWGEGNLDADPLFVDPQVGDYHLLARSALLNSGDPDFLPEPDETDIDGEERIMQNVVDIGADETLAQPVGIHWLPLPR